MPMSDEQRRASSERMKARHAARRAEQQKQTPPQQNDESYEQSTPPVPDEPQTSPKPPTTGGISMSDEQFAQLLQAIMQKPAVTPQVALEQTAALTAKVTNGGVQGVVFKYPTEKSHYPDLTDALYDDPELKRHAMRENYVFKWDVEGITYEKYGITYSEPRFTMKLFRKRFDDDGNWDPTLGLALVCTNIMHEDELATRQMANKLGILEDYENFDDLMNEIRHRRFRNWLLESFRPRRLDQHMQQARTMIVDGRAVEVFDTEQIIDGPIGRI